MDSATDPGGGREPAVVRESGAVEALYREVRRIREIAEARVSGARASDARASDDDARRIAELTRQVAELRATVARLRGAGAPGLAAVGHRA